MGNPAISLLVGVARHHDVKHGENKPFRRVVLVLRPKT